MYSTWELYGFPLMQMRISYRKHRHTLNRTELQHLRALGELVQTGTCSDLRSVTWLLPWRGEFRSLLQETSPVVLAYLLQHSSAPPMQRLAIWLLGCSCGTLGASVIANAARSGDVLIRREAARALQRKQGWVQLQSQLANDPDPRVRLLALQRPPRQYSHRLRTYLDQVQVQKVSGLRAALHVAFQPFTHSGRPPKSAEYIRTILQHIRALVHGVRPKA